MILKIASLAAKKSKTKNPLVIIAIGGFGRGELAPHSDIDLLLLDENGINKKFVTEITSALWSARLRPALSVRTLDECRETMNKDLHFLTSLLDIRYLWGNKKLYGKVAAAISNYIKSRPPGDFIAAKLEERDRRHKKMGDTRYHLEPNIKESKGGLRDIQTLLWLTRFTHGVAAPKDLARKSILTDQEAASLDRALDFFWRVRCHLHLIAGRAEDRLSFDMQPLVAERMGYDDPEPNVRAESFMKDYFLMANETGHLTRVLCADLEARAIVTTATAGTKKIALGEEIEGFPLKHGRLTVESFHDDLVEVIRLFRVSQTSGYDIHPDAWRLIRVLFTSSPPLPALSSSMFYMRSMRAGGGAAEATKLFLDILLDKKNAEQTLRRMNEAGVLTALIPDFANIHAHMQYDMYHVFTADEHTIRAVGLMHKLENGDLAQEAPLATSLFPKIHSRRALYAAMFLHDIAKGMGGEHAQKGAEIAKRLCPLFGLSPEETDTAAWLVENHLLMTMTAFKRDLGDGKTIADFASAVQSPELLKLLTILTAADIMAVGPDRWNSWKSGLLTELYHKTNNTLTGAGQENGSGHDQIIVLQKQARRLAGENKAALNYLIDTAPKSFWLGLSVQDIAKYASFIKPEAQASVIKISPMPENDCTEVFVYTPDRKGLFAGLTGAMAASGASIAEARIFTLSDGMALDIFQIHDLKGHTYENISFIHKIIKRCLAETLDFAQEITERQKTVPKKSRLFTAPSRVIIDNNASATNTLIEVNGKDKPGFLYNVASSLTALGLQIQTAKITTFGARAMDVFYVKDSFGLKILHPEKLASIQNTLKNTLESNTDERL